ncbi:nitronate monooxygenase [Nocardioides jiangxiensis]|uniref:Nitronate monooxygenase n=1 Tax=Nocardioides jiangxiensis TaxID=3064524 RepID=A0ABT9AWP6_9ACTN|nr:tRNA-dihydrouridine synthase [Nocardioides sp. WY-20]MDO7866884.1 nitronate monooxygenase [Nocardioides sp. WY-20]
MRLFVAAGCGGTGRELAPYADLAGVGGFVTRTLTLDPRRGSRLRIAESPSGLVRAHLLQNPGVDRFLTTEMPWLAQQGVPTWASVTGATTDEIAAVVRRVATAPGLSGIELNLAVDDPGALRLHDGSTPKGAAAAVRAVLDVLPESLALHVKLGSDVRRLPVVARAVAEVGADALVVGGALPAALPNGTAAELSGPAVLPTALRAVRTVCHELPEFPVIGVGGVRSAADVRAFGSAGARGVQVGSALLHDPSVLARITAELEEQSR